MPIYIALLRGINVGGNNLVAMAELQALAARLGFAQARTWLQSGNLIFTSDETSPAILEALLEREAEQQFGFHVSFMVRTTEEWGRIVTANPFSGEADIDPARLILLLLKDNCDEASWDSLRQAVPGEETLHGSGSHGYIYYPDGQGRSRLTNALIEKKLDVRATARNWNTVLKLLALTQLS